MGTRQGNGQKQLQISKQKQVQDQAYSYGTMGNFFSAMEWYANKCINQPPTHQFDYYNNFDCGNKSLLLDFSSSRISISCSKYPSPA